MNGYRVGRKIGFPTANLRIGDCEKLVPADGVLCRLCFPWRGKACGDVEYRLPPTLNNGIDRSIEVHIFNFDADIYNQPVRLSFVCRTRPELKFDSIDELIAQLHKDEAEITAILS